MGCCFSISIAPRPTPEISHHQTLVIYKVVGLELHLHFPSLFQMLSLLFLPFNSFQGCSCGFICNFTLSSRLFISFKYAFVFVHLLQICPCWTEIFWCCTAINLWLAVLPSNSSVYPPKNSYKGHVDNYRMILVMWAISYLCISTVLRMVLLCITSTWSHFCSILLLFISTSGIPRQLALQSSWHQIGH